MWNKDLKNQHFNVSNLHFGFSCCKACGKHNREPKNNRLRFKFICKLTFNLLQGNVWM